MNKKKLLVGAVLVIVALPVVLPLIAWGAFYTLLSLYAPNRTSGAIVSSGEKREYLLYVPKSYDRTRPTPLVISMHAAMNGLAFQMKLSQWNKSADENAFIVVYPAGTDPLHLGPSAWFMNGSRNPSTMPVAADVTRREYTNCAENAAVVLYTIRGGGHQWPNGKPIPEWLVGPMTREIDATGLMWAFFREHRLPGK